ncbi:hypothetical protein [Clostridium butyricum]|nr:hypothetical protein [Clostridium butyricum]MCQ2027139.1 hypothetical protein [Clostridium butyricum]
MVVFNKYKKIDNLLVQPSEFKVNRDVDEEIENQFFNELSIALQMYFLRLR